MEAASKADLTTALLGVFIPQLLYWFFEVLITERHVTWFHGPFDWRKYIWVRGALYILMLITNTLGSGGIFLYLQRKTRMTWSRLLGIMLFRYGLTLWGLGIFFIPATWALHYYGIAQKAKINLWAWWGLLIFGVLFLIIAWSFWFRKYDFGRLNRLIVRNRESEFWTAFRTATRKQWLLTWAMALPPLWVTFLGCYFLTHAFGVEVPFIEFMVVSPLALLVMDLPIAFSGFGTATLAWVIFFGDYGTAEEIAALTLFYPFVRAACRALFGIISLKPAIKDISMLSLSSSKKSKSSAPELELEES